MTRSFYTTLRFITLSALLVTLASLTFRQSGSYRDPETLWRRTIAENPRSALANNNLGSLLYRDGRVHDAMYYLERATTLDPKNAEAHNNLGNALRAEGWSNKAIPEYETAIALEPDVAQFHANLASCLTEAGLIDKAIGHYEDAVRADPSDPFVLNNLAWLLATTREGLKRDHPERALELARKAVELSPNDPVAEGTLAAAYAAAGQFESAAVQAEKAHNLAVSQNNRRADVLKEMVEAYREKRIYP